MLANRRSMMHSASAKNRLWLRTLHRVPSVTIRAIEKPADRIKLDAPDNSNNQMFNKLASNGAITEYDRQKNEDGSAKTAFTEGVAYVRFYMYVDVTVDGVTERVIVSWFDLDKDGYLYDYNGNVMGAKGGKCEGTPGNFYGMDGNYHNFIKASFDQGAAAQGFGFTNVNTTFYIACQSITDNPEVYENSDIGAMGSGWTNI